MMIGAGRVNDARPLGIEDDLIPRVSPRRSATAVKPSLSAVCALGKADVGVANVSELRVMGIEGNLPASRDLQSAGRPFLAAARLSFRLHALAVSALPVL